MLNSPGIDEQMPHKNVAEHTLPHAITGLTAVVTSLAAMQIPEYAWLMYVSVAVVLISCFGLIWRVISGSVVEALKRARDMYVLSQTADKYFSQIKFLRIARDIDNEVARMEWNTQRPTQYGSLENSLGFAEALPMPAKWRLLSTNLVVTITVRTFDEWLRDVDRFIKAGAVNYVSIDQKHKLTTMIMKYERSVNEHNILVDNINHHLSLLNLCHIYTNDHCFDWDELQTKQKSSNSSHEQEMVCD